MEVGGNPQKKKKETCRLFCWETDTGFTVESWERKLKLASTGIRNRTVQFVT